MENFSCKQESHLCSVSSHYSLWSSAQVASAIASFLMQNCPKLYIVSLHLCQDRTLLSFYTLEGKIQLNIKNLLKYTLEKIPPLGRKHGRSTLIQIDSHNVCIDLQNSKNLVTFSLIKALISVFFQCHHNFYYHTKLLLSSTVSVILSRRKIILPVSF